MAPVRLHRNCLLLIYLLLSTGISYARGHDPLFFTRSATNGLRTSYIQRPIIKRPFIIGISWNIVDDDGSPYRYFFRFARSWNMVPYPSRLTIERFAQRGFSTEGAFCYDLYKPGKIINGKTIGGAFPFASADLNVKYYLAALMGESAPRHFDPYFIFGAGFTLRVAALPALPFAFTANAGLGFHFWIGKNWGLNFQSMAKFGIKHNFYRTNANYLQHTFGFVFRFDPGQHKRNPFIKPRYPWVHRRHPHERV